MEFTLISLRDNCFTPLFSLGLGLIAVILVLLSYLKEVLSCDSATLPSKDHQNPSPTFLDKKAHVFRSPKKKD